MVGHVGELEDVARRAWRRTVPIAIGGFIVGAVVGVLLSGGEAALTRFLAILGFGLALGGLSGAGSLLPATFKLAPSMQQPTRELDGAARRSVRRAVFSGRPIGTQDELALRAFEWAQGAVVSLPISLGQFLLLYAGIAGPQLPNLVRDDGWFAGFARVFVAALVAVGVAFSISFSRRIRGARRYVAAARGR